MVLSTEPQQLLSESFNFITCLWSVVQMLMEWKSISFIRLFFYFVMCTVTFDVPCLYMYVKFGTSSTIFKLLIHYLFDYLVHLFPFNLLLQYIHCLSEKQPFRLMEGILSFGLTENTTNKI